MKRNLYNHKHTTTKIKNSSKNSKFKIGSLYPFSRKKTTDTSHIFSQLRTCNEFFGQYCGRDDQYRNQDPRHYCDTEASAQESRVLSTALHFIFEGLRLVTPRGKWMLRLIWQHDIEELALSLTYMFNSIRAT